MASYLGNSPDVILQVRKRNFRYIATSSQTSFNGTDSNGLIMSINTADVEVFLNGVLLDQTDYTITSTILTLGSGAATGDIVEVITNTAFAVADQYTKQEVDSKVSTAISDLVGTAGSALNTLGELSDALADDANYAATITTALGTKANTSTVNSALALKVGIDSTTGAATIPSGTTAQRPTGQAGMIRHNTTTGLLEFFDTTNNVWSGVGEFQALGGTITTVGSYKYHTFTTSGTFQVVGGTKSLDVLAVAGGGGGGSTYHGGGGGAGGLIDTTYTAFTGSYSIVIGSGGAGGVAGSPGAKGSSGQNTTAFGLTAIGGGGGASYGQGGAGAGNGGSGGGASQENKGLFGTGIAGQGYRGGDVSSTQSWMGGGGGGGAAAQGTDGFGNGSPSASIGGAGGVGINWKSLGTFYAGGGGGSYGPGGSGGAGGNGGGGNGSSSQGSAGSANRGGGGGGSERNDVVTMSFVAGGNGGSGVVIIRYAV